MGKFYFKKILFQEGWKKNVKISTDNNGKIEEIIENFEGTDHETKIQLAIPGIPNALLSCISICNGWINRGSLWK